MSALLPYLSSAFISAFGELDLILNISNNSRFLNFTQLSKCLRLCPTSIDQRSNKPVLELTDMDLLDYVDMVPQFNTVPAPSGNADRPDQNAQVGPQSISRIPNLIEFGTEKPGNHLRRTVLIKPYLQRRSPKKGNSSLVE